MSRPRRRAGAGFAMLLAVAWGLAPTLAAAESTVEYIHTDLLGSIAVVTDATANVIERREYEPYGAQLAPTAQDGPGYTGHVQDAATGLVYMEQRYYDPVLGSFLSVDPIAPTGRRNFNRYTYAANNPYRYTDPDGRDCKSLDNITTCSFKTTGSRIRTEFSFETPQGWPSNINSSHKHHHLYGKAVSAGDGSAYRADSIRSSIIRDPTPGPHDRPASSQGVVNNATPGGGCCQLVSIESRVKTYLRSDANGNPMVVNVTLPGHPLFPGYVARFVTVENGQAIVHNVGEGAGLLQSQNSTLRAKVADAMFNNVWYPQSEQNIQDGGW